MAIEALDSNRFTCNRLPLDQEEDDHGHYRETQEPVFITSEDDLYYRCPFVLTTRFTQKLLADYVFFQKSMLPYEEPIYDQPSKYVEGMVQIERIVEDVKQNKEEVAQKFKRMAAMSSLPKG